MTSTCRGHGDAARRAVLRVGKRVRSALYLHVSALGAADVAIRDRVEKADRLARQPWNVARVDGNVVSLLLYEPFENVAFPALLAVNRVRLQDGDVARTDYSRRENPPILHRKETLLRTDDPRRPVFAAVTRLAEEHGLFKDAHRIGTRKVWLQRVEAAGLIVKGPKLLRRDVDPVDVARHRTAIARRDLSLPLQLLIGHGIVSQRATVLDYGCGQGDDVASLVANGFQAYGWDPHYAPEGPRCTADVVNLGFVLNVIEDEHERAETLNAAYALAGRALSVAVMTIGKYAFEGLRPYRDGYVTARGTFQKYFAQQELRDFIVRILGEAPVGIAPGVCVVFRDKELEQEVLFKRQARGLSRPIGWRIPDRPRRQVTTRLGLSERIRTELEALWGAIEDRGRTLDLEEVPEQIRQRLRAANVSLARATDMCLSTPSARENLAVVTAARREDVLIHLALMLFPGSPRYATLARSIQRDVRAFFGSHAAALQEANTLLFSVGNPEIIRNAVAASVEAGLGGMHDSETFRFFAPALNRLRPELRVLVGCAGMLRGGVVGVDFIDIKLDARRISFISCVDSTSRLPVYSERTRLDLGRLKISSDFPEDKLLYLKGRFLPRDTSGIEEQRAFDDKLIAAGIVDQEGRGPRRSDLEITVRKMGENLS